MSEVVIIPILHPFWNLYSQVIQYVHEWVCFSSSSDLEKCSITSVAPLMDPLQWMGAVRMRVQTADKNIRAVWTLILTAPIHCRGSIGEQVIATFLHIWWRNKLIYILDVLKVNTFFNKFYFLVNYSFNIVQTNFWYLLIKTSEFLHA